MGLDFTAWEWEPVNTIQVAAEETLWMVEFALALHRSEYYLRVRTGKAGAADPARVRIVGPYPDVMHALAAVQDLIRKATCDLAGAICPERLETDHGNASTGQ